MKPTVGRIVHYTLTADDAAKINGRRSDGLKDDQLACPRGAQAHIGNVARAGDVLPMIVVRAWESDMNSVNGQVFLDGTDTYWVTSATEGSTPGAWAWPPRAP